MSPTPLHASGVPKVSSARLDDHSGITHGFFTRKGGISPAPYDTLNTGLGSGDDPRNIKENRKRCASALSVSTDRLVTGYQVHSATAHIIDRPWQGPPPEGDALVTNSTGLAIGILTADCMPYLFFDPTANVIAAAHAGWRGALGGILECTIEKMVTLGASPDTIEGALGPCLRQPNFEVGLELVSLFTKKYPQAEQFFSPGITPEKRQLDLASFGRWRLKTLGVTKLDDTNICTLGTPESFFSYRFMKQNQLADYGRNLSAITINA